MLTNEETLTNEVIAKIDSMTQRLSAGAVPKDDIEAVAALRDGMQYGVEVLRIREYDKGNSRREAIMAQREKRSRRTL
ncbi:hypothetical protein LCGC14_1135950 [marine sediment metagenome]|uniref:Uncharacterized protein n=1 Tax=marine sediment metagenome TaxID=412755 RepID=A0A0F9LZV3_9ZZZZ